MMFKPIRKVLFWRFPKSPSEKIAAVCSSYRLACNNERVSKKRGCTQGIGKARKQMQDALHAALRGR